MNKYNEILKLLQCLSDEEITLLIKNKEKYQHNLEVSNIENFLKELCVNPFLLGFNYLKEAIELCLNDQTVLNSITTYLYPTIAKNNNTTPSRVETYKVDGETYYNVFFNEMEKPTNSKYIAYICSYINNFQMINIQKQKS